MNADEHDTLATVVGAEGTFAWVAAEWSVGSSVTHGGSGTGAAIATLLQSVRPHPDTLLGMEGRRDGPDAPFHAGLVALAARAYEAHLRAMPESRVDDHPVNLIHRTVQAALSRGPALRPNEVVFSARTLEGVALPDRRRLLNQFTLGLGRDDAEVVAMGTEPAFSIFDDPVSLCTENVGNHVVWLTHGSPTIVGALTNHVVRNTDSRRFHIYPNDHYDVGRGHTWARLARVLGSGEEYARDAEPALGSLCYQIDASALPAPNAASGLPPTEERLRFLVSSVLPTLASTARVLLIHGASLDDRDRDRLARAFVGLDENTIVSWRDHLSRSGSPLRFFDHRVRRVIACRALGNSISPDFIARLKTVVMGAGTPPPSGPPVRRRRP